MTRSIFLAIPSMSLAKALLIVALRDHTATAYTLVLSTILTIWNVLFALMAVTLTFGLSEARTILGRRDRISAEGQTSEANA